jgi:anti-anti-sigma factor
MDDRGNIICIRVNAGILTNALSRELVGICRQRLEQNGIDHWIVDLSQVEFIDSTCIGMFVGFVNDIAATGGVLALAACQPNVKFLIETTRLDLVFRMCADAEDAFLKLAESLDGG